MTITVIVAAQVSDFDQWKAQFDSLEKQRLEAGIRLRAYCMLDNSNASYVIGTAPSKEAFMKFFSSPERQAIQESGIITSKPEITFLK